MPTSSSSSPARFVAPVLGAHAEAVLDRLGDLVADPPDRVEGVHRALEDDADLAPAVAPQRVLGLGHEVDPEQLDAAALRRSARSRAAAGRATGRSSSCRSRTRRRSRAPRRRSSVKLTPSTALTVPDSSVKWVRRSSTTSSGACGVGLLRAAATAAGRGPSSRAVSGKAPAIACGACRSLGRQGAPRTRSRRHGPPRHPVRAHGRRHRTSVPGQTQLVPRVGHRRVLDFGLRMSSSALPTSVKARTTRTTQTAGRHDVPPRPEAGRAGALRRVEDLAPRRRRTDRRDR